MITGRPTFVRLEIDVQKYRKALQDSVEVQMRQAARAWLRVLLRPGLIPIWTGTSRGVFIPLGAYLRVKTTISPLVYRKNQGPAFGAAESDYSFTRSGGKHTFRFSHSVGRLTYNAQFNANLVGFRLKTPGPYKAFEQATDAWNLYVQNEMPKKLPNPGNFEKRSTIIYG